MNYVPIKNSTNLKRDIPREYTKHYNTVKAIKFDGLIETSEAIAKMCQPLDFIIKRRDSDIFALLECMFFENVEFMTINQVAFSLVEIGSYVVKEPNSFCYVLPARTFEIIYNVEHKYNS